MTRDAQKLSDDAARRRLLALEARIAGSPPILPPYFSELQMEIRQLLDQACRSRRLTNNFRDLKPPLYSYTNPDQRGIAVIAGGSRAEFWTDSNQFRRDDKAHFNFILTVRYPPGGGAPALPELIAYHFNVAFPDKGTPETQVAVKQIPPFVRFDLNDAEYAKPVTRDPLRSPLLCHSHPGHPEMTVPSPILAPQEILDLVLHGHLR